MYLMEGIPWWNRERAIEWFSLDTGGTRNVEAELVESVHAKMRECFPHLVLEESHPAMKYTGKLTPALI